MTTAEPKKEGGIYIEGVSGQVAIGNQNVMTQNIRTEAAAVSAMELETLQKMFDSLKAQIAQSAPAETKDKALEKTAELEEAIHADKPDLTTMEYVKNWFVKNLPQLAGAVTGLVVNPIVGKLVAVAGEALADEFKRRFGS